MTPVHHKSPGTSPVSNEPGVSGSPECQWYCIIHSVRYQPQFRPMTRKPVNDVLRFRLTSAAAWTSFDTSSCVRCGTCGSSDWYDKRRAFTILPVADIHARMQESILAGCG